MHGQCTAWATACHQRLRTPAAANASTSSLQGPKHTLHHQAATVHACTWIVSPQAIEHAFKNETVGLVTKAEFMKKRETLQER
jgi:hypothetical protein